MIVKLVIGRAALVRVVGRGGVRADRAVSADPAPELRV